jgi:hypothetical protein
MDASWLRTANTDNVQSRHYEHRAKLGFILTTEHSMVMASDCLVVRTEPEFAKLDVRLAGQIYLKK